MSPPPENGPRTAEDVLAIIQAMSVAEKERLARLLEDSSNPLAEVGYVAIPLGLLETIIESQGAIANKIAPEYLNLIKTLVNKSVRRNRQSAPETVLRNVRICDLRKEDRKKWSLNRLAKENGMTARGITKILTEEAKWRRLAAKQEPSS